MHGRNEQAGTSSLTWGSNKQEHWVCSSRSRRTSLLKFKLGFILSDERKDESSTLAARASNVHGDAGALEMESGGLCQSARRPVSRGSLSVG